MGRPAQQASFQDPGRRVHNWEEICAGFTLQQALAEASRCIYCPAAPCQQACPLHNDIPGAIALLEAGDPIAAADHFRLTSPMPAVCGRVCPQERLCEGACVIGKRGVPVQIGKLERFVADTARSEGRVRPVNVARATGRSVAIIGAGPAGIAAAELLREAGHRVVVFDAWPKPGGLLQYGIPRFKLPRDVTAAEIERLVTAGVEFVTKRRIDLSDPTMLRSEGFDAVLITVGASTPVRLGIPGEDLAGIWTATEFLVRANGPLDGLSEAWQSPPVVGRHVVVIGGGDTAMDCCRSAIRLGAPHVLCLYRRSEAEMPGRREERLAAREEGVTFEFLAAPRRFLGENGRVTGVECVRMTLGDPDETGRRRVQPIPDSTFVIPADAVVIAAGYRVDVAPTPLQRRADGTIAVDPATGATNLLGVFAAGDAVNGADLVVTALASGRRAARAIDAYLRGEAWPNRPS